MERLKPGEVDLGVSMGVDLQFIGRKSETDWEERVQRERERES
jgi:hypothetical protein